MQQQETRGGASGGSFRQWVERILVVGAIRGHVEGSEVHFVYSFLDTSPALHESRRNAFSGTNRDETPFLERIETFFGNESKRNASSGINRDEMISWSKSGIVA
jgi:hypothetical protein